MFLFKNCFWTFIGATIGLLFTHLFGANSNPSNLALENWVGDWTVNLEEFDDFAYTNKGVYQLQLTVQDNRLTGIVFNEKGREQAYLKNIKAAKAGYSLIRGKIGNKNGSKQEFEFMMFPNGKSFVGKYRHRHQLDHWKLWVSHREK